ncbi:MAG: hypothetical protein ACLFRM_08705 [Guyparkeria sp.]|uniref:hypothetical protein n=1 Tax=Guyparkeria sp. TaxID=2035736 RepID=UPI00397C2575
MNAETSSELTPTPPQERSRPDRGADGGAQTDSWPDGGGADRAAEERAGAIAQDVLELQSAHASDQLPAAEVDSLRRELSDLPSEAREQAFARLADRDGEYEGATLRIVHEVVSDHEGMRAEWSDAVAEHASVAARTAFLEQSAGDLASDERLARLAADTVISLGNEPRARATDALRTAYDALSDPASRNEPLHAMLAASSQLNGSTRADATLDNERFDQVVSTLGEHFTEGDEYDQGDSFRAYGVLEAATRVVDNTPRHNDAVRETMIKSLESLGDIIEADSNGLTWANDNSYDSWDGGLELYRQIARELGRDDLADRAGGALVDDAGSGVERFGSELLEDIRQARAGESIDPERRQEIREQYFDLDRETRQEVVGYVADRGQTEGEHSHLAVLADLLPTYSDNPSTFSIADDMAAAMIDNSTSEERAAFITAQAGSLRAEPFHARMGARMFASLADEPGGEAAARNVLSELNFHANAMPGKDPNQDLYAMLTAAAPQQYTGGARDGHETGLLQDFIETTNKTLGNGENDGFLKHNVFEGVNRLVADVEPSGPHQEQWQPVMAGLAQMVEDRGIDLVKTDRQTHGVWEGNLDIYFKNLADTGRGDLIVHALETWRQPIDEMVGRIQEAHDEGDRETIEELYYAMNPGELEYAERDFELKDIENSLRSFAEEDLRHFRYALAQFHEGMDERGIDFSEANATWQGLATAGIWSGKAVASMFAGGPLGTALTVVTPFVEAGALTAIQDYASSQIEGLRHDTLALGALSAMPRNPGQDPVIIPAEELQQLQHLEGVEADQDQVAYPLLRPDAHTGDTDSASSGPSARDVMNQILQELDRAFRDGDW